MICTLMMWSVWKLRNMDEKQRDEVANLIVTNQHNTSIAMDETELMGSLKVLENAFSITPISLEETKEKTVYEIVFDRRFKGTPTFLDRAFANYQRLVLQNANGRYQGIRIMLEYYYLVIESDTPYQINQDIVDIYSYDRELLAKDFNTGYLAIDWSQTMPDVKRSNCWKE